MADRTQIQPQLDFVGGALSLDTRTWASEQLWQSVALRFFLTAGTLSTHWIADWGTLWQPPLTDAHLRTSAAYYHILASMEGVLTLVPVAVAGLGGLALLWSFRDGRAGNLMFDGASIFLYACTVFVYYHSVIPSLTHLSEPLPSTVSSIPKSTKEATLNLASYHLVCSVALTGVLILQAARYWAESPDGDEGSWGTDDTAPERKIRPSRRHSAGEEQSTPSQVRDSVSSRRRDGSLRRKGPNLHTLTVPGRTRAKRVATVTHTQPSTFVNTMSSRSGSTPAPSIRSTPASRRPIAANISGHGRTQTPRVQTPRATPPVESTPGSVTPELRPLPHTQIHHQRSPYSPHEASAATYPRFLPVWETARLQIGFFARGLLDANRWDRVIKIVLEDAEVRSNVFKSLLLNSLSLASIYTLDLIFVPLLAGKQDKWLHRNFGSLYTVFWLLPVIGVSLYLNSTFSSGIAKRIFQLQHGRSVAPAPTGFSGMLNTIATSAYRVILIFSYMSISLALSYVPIIGSTAAFIFVCWIDAFYCFEPVWIASGMRLSERVRYEEERWAYFLAFGLPSTALCMSGSSLANAAVFALIYPAYIIMATSRSTKPQPDNPYQPIPPSEYDPNPAPIFPSPFVPIRIPFFAPVIWLNDQVAKLLDLSTGGGRGRRASSTGPSIQMEGVEEGVGRATRAGFRLRKEARKLD
ncbi:Etoposide-induced protein 2.4 (EI24) [Rhizoctonia solani]|uniref:Etoposide-induced protein 2.4 (EI24) n=1 Tax=Rhizoctonia solani TaxID=456999 RepID=A0A8H7HEI7_9AGAM|nr:Etoposide-induced protein 2.4 (EI24) [Rhizoctonia solani]